MLQQCLLIAMPLTHVTPQASGAGSQVCTQLIEVCWASLASSAVPSYTNTKKANVGDPLASSAAHAGQHEHGATMLARLQSAITQVRFECPLGLQPCNLLHTCEACFSAQCACDQYTSAYLLDCSGQSVCVKLAAVMMHHHKLGACSREAYSATAGIL